MKRLMLYILVSVLMTNAVAQTIIEDEDKEITLTKEQLLEMDLADLSNLSFEELLYGVELLGVESVDQLFEIILNKNVSSASKKDEDSFKSPLSTSIITREEMRTFGCTTVEEALRLLPGMIVREKTNGVCDVHIRGLDNIPDGNMFLYSENVNTLVMVDGRPVFNYGTGAMLWESLPVGIEDIERIEVVRGPSSALYGSNAVSGVINIITEKPTNVSKFISANVQAGTHNTYVGDLAIRKSFNDKFGFSITGNVQFRDRPTSKIYIIPDSLTYDSRNDSITYENGGWVKVEDLDYLRKIDDLGNTTHVLEQAVSAEKVFDNSSLARKSIGVNGTLYYTPQPDIIFTLSGGYQTSKAMQSGTRYDVFPMHFRESEQGFVDLNMNMKGLCLQVNYTGGPQDFMPGGYSFKVKNQQFTANLDYDWEVADRLFIRPGVNYRWNKMDDSDYAGKDARKILDSFGDTTILSGYFDGAAKLIAIAPSIRVDYTLMDKFRFVLAYRAEKLSNPNKWYHSFQAAVNYSLNDKHDLRVIYSRANRSAIFLNTKINYDQVRTDYAAPNEAKYRGSDSDVMSADNIEVGYRWRPIPNILIDAEAYWNWSRDYGTLLAKESSFMFRSYDLVSAVLNDMLAIQMGTMNAASMRAGMDDIIRTSSTIQYANMPYNVKSRGISINIDWVATEKLIVKLQGNLQKTTIDNYYLYHFYDDLKSQLTVTESKFSDALNDMVYQLTNDIATNTNIIALATAYPMTDSEKATLQKQYDSAVASGTEKAFLDNLLEENEFREYYYLLYGMETDETGHLYIGTSTETNHELVNKHVHKNTPTFYGMVGVLYKPIEKLSLSANGYYYTKQTMSTYAGDTKINSKFNLSLKIGYKPIDMLEVYFNAHNILNDKSREFAFTDKIPGIYSIGVDFKF